MHCTCKIAQIRTLDTLIISELLLSALELGTLTPAARHDAYAHSMPMPIPKPFKSPPRWSFRSALWRDTSSYVVCQYQYNMYFYATSGNFARVIHIILRSHPRVILSSAATREDYNDHDDDVHCRPPCSPVLPAISV